MKQAQKVVSEILVMQYTFGEPFPGLMGQLDSADQLPKEAQIIVDGPTGDHPLSQGKLIGRYGIVNTTTQGIVLVKHGDYMQVSGPVDRKSVPACIGRVPADFKL